MIHSMRAFVSYSVLLLFLLSGALPANVIPVQSHAQFAAEPEPGSFYREDESTRSSASRKLAIAAENRDRLLAEI
jgi:hypothetical protein